jgi:septal ring factor EnvC (AmiA/AmiB activator)
MSEDPTKDLGEKYDTRPMLENLLREMREGFAGVNTRLDRIDERLASLERKVKILNEDILQVRADIAGIDQRVTRLEESRT